MNKVIFSVIFGVFLLSNSAVAFVKNELARDSHIIVPTKSQNFNYAESVERYVVSDYSELTYREISRKIIRDIGSNIRKHIRIIWTDKASQKLAVKFQKMLVNKGIDSKRIKLVRHPYKRSTYPLYIEIEHIGAKMAKCSLRIAEQMTGDVSYVPCATNSNSHIQLKY
ncbi:RcpB [Pasteurella multocida]|uniref:RcpB n=1 Tax=Pasteurella multocida TaxID=747 RepID=UPI0024472C07|nr:RcpB [Pasteurella multocida]MDH3003246.1 RcpB [Pasteurella multocida]